MALMLSTLGAKVFIISRKQDVLDKTATEIMSKTGNQVAYFATDIRNIDHVKESIEFCEKTLGDLPSIVINNAAGNFISPTERLSPNAIKSVIDIVLYGTLNVTLTLGKKLIEANKRKLFFLLIIYPSLNLLLIFSCNFHVNSNNLYK
jgi:2,4-dienoyl-CoA reductase